MHISDVNECPQRRIIKCIQLNILVEILQADDSLTFKVWEYAYNKLTPPYYKKLPKTWETQEYLKINTEKE